MRPPLGRQLAPAWTTQAIDISRRTRMDQVAVHRAIKSLIAKDLLKRQAHGRDMRRKPLQLTRKGLAVYRDMQPAARDVEAELLRLLDARERKVLRALLGKLYRATRVVRLERRRTPKR